ncbi:MAG: hypothetical protein JNL32_08085 [Candidatus Kapabacteria bacterium]|nr:hypothetical protein [Candidatus Kapabacteria bacterium]
MNKVAVVCVMAVVMMSGCSKNFDRERFISTYAEILIEREQQSDSTKANTNVQSILTKHSYTEAEFRTDFIALAQKPNDMRTLMDSVHQRVRTLTSTKK